MRDLTFLEYAQGDLLTKNFIKMKEFIRRWSNWWILNPKRKQLDDAFEKELNELIEREVALRIHDVVGGREQLLEEQSNWLMANTSLAVEKIVDFKEHFK